MKCEKCKEKEARLCLRLEHKIIPSTSKTFELCDECFTKVHELITGQKVNPENVELENKMFFGE